MWLLYHHVYFNNLFLREQMKSSQSVCTTSDTQLEAQLPSTITSKSNFKGFVSPLRRNLDNNNSSITPEQTVASPSPWAQKQEKKVNILPFSSS